MTKFDGRQAGYLDGVRRNVPGLESLHRMTGLLLAERAPLDAHILVVGAGGGLELKALADQNKGWSFDGVDPSSDMLALAQETISEHADRIRLRRGDVRAAPKGPYNGAVCLMVFHHLSPEDKADTLWGVHQRLAPGAPFVLAHVSYPQNEPERSIWAERHIEFGAAETMDADMRNAAKIDMRERLFVRSPEEELSSVRDAGFSDITQFYHAYSFRGWVAYA